jgi:hypothetical protein
MARGECKFRQREITRALKAARAAGLAVDRVEITSDGKIVVHVGSGDDLKHTNTADIVMERLKHHGKS